MLASLEDINLHLPEDKLEVDEARYAPLQQDAERIVRGYLAGVYSASTLATWTTPDTTPGLVRAIASRLVAAFYYRVRYSEDALADPEYAKTKYDEAMGMLNQIIAGTLVLEEVTTDTASGSITSADFYPNASASEPVFTMSMEL